MSVTLRVRVSTELRAAVDRAAAKQGVPTSSYVRAILWTRALAEKFDADVQSGARRCACGGRLSFEGAYYYSGQVARDIGVPLDELGPQVRTRCLGCGEWVAWDAESGDALDGNKIDAPIATEKGWTCL